MDGNAALSAFVERLRALRQLATETARAAAPLVERAARETAAAGTDPEGNRWAPTKDGRRPLANAAAAIRGVAVGSAVQLVVRGYHVFHHHGTARLPQRRILPEGAIPKAIGEAVRAAARLTFTRTVGGG
jgi:hypothetical protein